MNLEDIQLTEEDFKMLAEGLDALPEKGKTGIVLADLLGAAIAGPDLSMKKEIEKKTAEMSKEFEAKNNARKDDITLLQSKLIMLKRLLQTEGALKTAEAIIGKK